MVDRWKKLHTELHVAPRSRSARVKVVLDMLGGRRHYRVR
jgi:hypothetical protein